jgi:hypothetical protein
MLLCLVHNLKTGQRYEFQAADQMEADARIARKAGTYGAPTERELSILDLSEQEREAVMGQAVRTVQMRLDALAQSWGYDSILSLCTYSTSGVERFRAEGQAGVDFRDATWAAVEQWQDVHSIEELLRRLPPLPSRPTV